MPKPARFIAYYRVSTQQQGRSGLGLEAQKEAVRQYLAGNSGQLMAEVTEIESGKRNNRPQLAEALRLCRLHKAALVIAKLDRLARSLHFVSSLMESGVEFTACDFPQANRLTVHIMAAVAEHEAAMISQRTRAALAAAKARGIKLGGDGKHLPGLAREAARASVAARVAAADRISADVGPSILALQTEGKSLRQIAAALDAGNILAPRGGAWSAVQVRRIAARLAASPQLLAT